MPVAMAAPSLVEPAIRHSRNGVWAMWLIVVVFLVVVIASVGAARGQVWGPVVLSVGSAAWGGFLLLFSGLPNFQMIGMFYLMAGAGEFVAASNFSTSKEEGPTRGARAGAALAGAAIGLGTLLLLLALAGAIGSAMFI